MEAVGTLAGGIAHDFNNSLQAISGFTQLLLMDDARPKQDKEMLATIKQAARHAEELTRQLLTFSRKIENNPVPLDLNREIRGTCRLLERTLPKMIRIESRLQEDLPIIRVDKVQLEQVIMNMGINAGHAMPDGGRLIFETKTAQLEDDECRPLGIKPGKFVRLTISDTGIGMDEKTRQHIFEPFFTTRGTGSGTGLGLATVYGIVTNHGGAITCTSAVGQGTRFEIYLPATGLAEIDQEALTPQVEMVGGQETVLIVDDDPVVRRLGCDLLERFGYTILEAASGEECLEAYDRRGAEIELVILDLNMPGMGGANCLTHLMDRDAPPRVIIASGYPPKGTIKRTLKKGARGFIGKPFNLPEMLQMVREVLDQTDFIR
jgi:CheY-like chemotaxis protein